MAAPLASIFAGLGKAAATAGKKVASSKAVRGAAADKIKSFFGGKKKQDDDQEVIPARVSVIEDFASAVRGSGGSGGSGGAIVSTGSSVSSGSSAIVKTGDNFVDKLEEIKKILQRLLDIEMQSLKNIQNQILNFARDTEKSDKQSQEDRQEKSKKSAKKTEDNPIVKESKKAFKGIFDFIKSIVVGFIKYKILDWLSKPENTKKIQATIQFFKNLFQTLKLIYDVALGPQLALANSIRELLAGGFNIFTDLIGNLINFFSFKWLPNIDSVMKSLEDLPKIFTEMIPNAINGIINFFTKTLFGAAEDEGEKAVAASVGELSQDTSTTTVSDRSEESEDNASGSALSGIKDIVGNIIGNTPIGMISKGAFGVMGAIGNAFGNTPIGKGVMGAAGAIGNTIGGMFGGDKGTPQLKEGGIVGPKNQSNSEVSVKPLDKLGDISGIGSILKKSIKMFMELLILPIKLIGAAIIALILNTIGKIPGVGLFISPLLDSIISKFGLPPFLKSLVMRDGKFDDELTPGKKKKDKRKNKNKKPPVSITGASAPAAGADAGGADASGAVTPGSGTPGEVLATDAKTTYYDPSLGGINASGIKTKDGLPATSTGEGYKADVFSAAAFPPLIAKLPESMTTPAANFPGGRTIKKPFNVIVKTADGKQAVIRVNDVGPGVEGHASNHMLDLSVAAKNYLGTGSGYTIMMADSNSKPGPLLVDTISNNKPQSTLTDTTNNKNSNNQSPTKTPELPKKASGGWISGPMSGYPVSLDGGRSIAFEGHGTEWVGLKKASGGSVSSAFVIPFDTPSTKSNHGLTNQRMNEAKNGGYQLPTFNINQKLNTNSVGLKKASGGSVSNTFVIPFSPPPKSNGGYVLPRMARGGKLKPTSNTSTENTTTKGVDKKEGTGGMPAVISAGKLLLQQGFTVAEHPNFKKNSWDKFSPNTGTGYTPSGNVRVGGHSGGSLHYKGLALDVTDWRSGDWQGRTKSLAEEMYKNRNALKLTQIIHDPWGSWFAGGGKGGAIGGHDTHLHLGFASGPGDSNVDLSSSGAGGEDSGSSSSESGGSSGGEASAKPSVVGEDDLKYLYTALTGKTSSSTSQSDKIANNIDASILNVPAISSQLTAVQKENIVTSALGKKVSTDVNFVQSPSSTIAGVNQMTDAPSLGNTLPVDGIWATYKTNL